jgi:hypothetical protein
LHTSPIGEHSRFLKTYHMIKKDFFWEGLKTNVQNFVFECVVFQQNKGDTIKTLGLLQPLSIPIHRWEEVHFYPNQKKHCHCGSQSMLIFVFFLILLK